MPSSPIRRDHPAVTIASASGTRRQGRGDASGWQRDRAWRGVQVNHLLRRTTFGITTELAEVGYAGRWAWLEAQLAPSSVDDAACDALLARWPALAMSPAQVRAAVDADQLGSWDAMYALGQAAIARALWSRRQLFEVMVDLWSNHLNITCPSSEVWDNRAHFDAAVVRPHALGRYADLLLAATVHPAMLTYLNNASSTKDAPNENLGRELLELHTVGIAARYGESDVLASARILTGHSIDWDTGEYVYRSEDHWTGPVRVLDFSHPNTTAAGGRDVLAGYLGYLARHPATARRIVARLAVRFVADDPPAALVERLASVYLSNDTAIVPVLRELFRSSEFAESVDAKTRRPSEALTAVVRALGLRPPASDSGADGTGRQGLADLFWMLGDLGQAPLGWPLPDGYPDVAAAWQSAGGTLARWNATASLAANWWPSTLARDPLLALVPSPLPGTHGELVDALWQLLHRRPVAAPDRAALCRFLGVTAATPLAADSPALDDGWLALLVALILDAPAVMLR